MSARRLPLLALVALLGGLAGCNKTSARPGLRLSGPSSVAVFHGITSRDPVNLRHYLAVANERGDDLRLIDAVDGTAVLAPGLVQTLSVPTAPRPALVAAGSLADTGDPGADLLVVAPAGLAACDPDVPGRLVGCLQVVDTWTIANAVSRSLTVVVDDVAGGADGAVLSLVVMPVPVDDGAGGFTAAPGQARVAAGLSGGRLLLVDFARAADGSGGVVQVGLPVVHDLGFEPISLSVVPDARYLNLLYAASGDPIGGVEGVAELDLRGPVTAPPPVRAIAAGAPTTHVLAATVRPAQASVANGVPDTFGAEVLRVYAALDPSFCGRDWPVTCGLAVLDPATGGPLPDPAGELPAHLPIAIPGSIISLVAIYPPTVGGVNVDGTPTPSGQRGELQKQANLTSTQLVSTLAAVATTTGDVVLVDLARGALARQHEVLATTFSANPTQVSSVRSSDATVEGAPRLALWGVVGGVPTLTTDGTTMRESVSVTPGFVPSETWALIWEGRLPELPVEVPGQVQGNGTGGGLAWLAVQSSTGLTPSAGPYRGVGRLYDPRSLVRPGDLVVVSPLDDPRCPRGVFEVEVTNVLPPTSQYPGGAVAVTPRPLAKQPTVQVGTELLPADPTCLDGADRADVRLTFRASGLILVGTDGFGYAGRPTLQDSSGPDGYALRWIDPASTNPAPPDLTCPLLDDPAFLDGTTWPPPTACDQACRDRCERLLLSRKARRQFYMADQCATADVTCSNRWKTLDPVGNPDGRGPIVNPKGPVLAFKVGQLWPGTDTRVPLERGATMTFLTVSGQTVPAYRPLSGGSRIGAVLPTGMVAFDRAGASGAATDGVRVFTGYTGDLVLDFTPSLGAATVVVHR